LDVSSPRASFAALERRAGHTWNTVHLIFTVSLLRVPGQAQDCNEKNNNTGSRLCSAPPGGSVIPGARVSIPQEGWGTYQGKPSASFHRVRHRSGGAGKRGRWSCVELRGSPSPSRGFGIEFVSDPCRSGKGVASGMSLFPSLTGRRRRRWSDSVGSGEWIFGVERAIPVDVERIAGVDDVGVDLTKGVRPYDPDGERSEGGGKGTVPHRQVSKRLPRRQGERTTGGRRGGDLQWGNAGRAVG